MEQKQKQTTPEQTEESPKGGSTLYRKGTASLAAEDMFEKQERDKDGNPVSPAKKDA